MNDLAKYEKSIDHYLRQGDNQKAIKGLLALIKLYAQQKDFAKCEELRERIPAISPSALSELILAQEMIDSARSLPATESHRRVWTELYDRLTDEETKALQNELLEAAFEPGQTIFSQGQKNANLYFISAGQAKHIYTQENREVFISKISAGNVANETSFFEAGLCTTSLVAIDRVKVHFLPAITLLSWEGYLPALEAKLRDFCSCGVKIHELLKKSSLDRRIQRRIPLPGRILLKIVDAGGAVVGKTIRGDIADVSVGGVSFYVQTPSREQALMLLGHNLHLRFNMPPDMAEIEQIGKVLGVRRHREAFDLKERYSVHVMFSEILPEKSIVEAERFIKMIRINEQNR
ncbi:MAG: cyclic nucleotide-binding domain-containing protein [Desulfurivibrionaceae bacterium]|nr:cyclic nucleotide-binding domain-containing protein [Desulfurivibrionaceae bacterium]